MSDETRPAGIAVGLREWRSRRRLSQLELALRTGTTQRHVSFIESGRSAPGRNMVIRLAESLEVPIRERNSLLLSAGFAPAYDLTPLDDPRMDAVRSALRHVLDGHLPYPAVVVDRAGDLVMANTAFGFLTADVADELLAPPVNVARLFLHPAGLAPRIINFDEWAWHVIDRLRAATLRAPHDKLQQLVDELSALVPGQQLQPPPGYLGFAVPMRLQLGDSEMQLMTTLSHFGTATDVTIAELRLEAFLPADSATADVLTGLAAASPPQSTDIVPRDV